jgi:uncharacterized protein (TIGR02001 family)
MNLSRAFLLASCLALGLPAAPALADVSFNASLTSDYRYRGISQTRLKPAVQGGADWSDASGFYAGTWASTIKWIKDGGGGSDVEIDVYGGYKTEVAKGLTLDVGLLQYYYPSHDLAVSPNTLEAYAGLSFGPATLKVSRSFKNLFGFSDSKGSMYYDLSATFDLGDGWSVTPHFGRQDVKNNKAFSYNDASLMVNKTIDAFTLSLGVVDAKTSAYVGPGNKDLGARRVVGSVKFVF